MKRFSFPLRRVLDLRLTQAHIEETKLARLHAELRASRTASITPAGSGPIPSVRWRKPAPRRAELAALDSFKKAVAAECAAP